MKDLLKDLIYHLRNNGFDFNLESKLSSYNPLEYFVGQVREKEIRPSQILCELRTKYHMFLYQKLIDRSTLRQGFQIPVEFHHLLEAMPGGMPQHRETRNVKPSWKSAQIAFYFPNGIVENEV